MSDVVGEDGATSLRRQLPFWCGHACSSVQRGPRRWADFYVPWNAFLLDETVLIRRRSRAQFGHSERIVLQIGSANKLAVSFRCGEHQSQCLFGSAKFVGIIFHDVVPVYPTHPHRGSPSQLEQ